MCSRKISVEWNRYKSLSMFQSIFWLKCTDDSGDAKESRESFVIAYFHFETFLEIKHCHFFRNYSLNTIVVSHQFKAKVFHIKRNISEIMPIYCLNITSYYERFKKAPRLTVIVDSENFYTSRISSKTVDGYLVTPWVSVTDFFFAYFVFDFWCVNWA